MANINLWQIYKDKRRRFGVSDSDNFRASFAEAVNMAHADFNTLVFDSETLSYLDSFDEVVDERLISFSTITFDSAFNTALGGREYWGIEYEFERLSATQTFTDTIAISGDDDLIISITNGVLEINKAGTIVADITLPDVNTYKIYIGSSSAGNYVYVNGDETDVDYADSISLGDVPDLDWVPDLDVTPGYTLGTASTSISIGTVSSHIISATTGLELKKYTYYSAAAIVADFPINDNSATITDDIEAYTGTVASGVWNTVYIEPQSGLDKKYQVPFGYALDYHLQNGGQWAIEPEPEREKQWYGRGINIARHIYNTTQTYQNPWGI